MTATYKSGDKVLCVAEEPERLTLNTVYTVKATFDRSYGSAVALYEVTGVWSTGRFEPYPDPPADLVEVAESPACEHLFTETRCKGCGIDIDETSIISLRQRADDNLEMLRSTEEELRQVKRQRDTLLKAATDALPCLFRSSLEYRNLEKAIAACDKPWEDHS